MNGYRYDRPPPGDVYSNHHRSSYRCDLLSNEPLSRSRAQRQRRSSPPTEKKSQQIPSTYSSSTTGLDQTQRKVGFHPISTLNEQRSPSTAYYDQIHQQVRLQESRRCNSPEARWNGNPSFNRSSIQTAPPIGRTLSPTQVKIDRTAKLGGDDEPFSSLQISLSNPKPVNSSALSSQSIQGDDPALNDPNYTIDSLIERLVPTRSYIPKVRVFVLGNLRSTHRRSFFLQQTFLHPMLLCSRMHIRPSLLLGKLGRATFDSFLSVNRVTSTNFRSFSIFDVAFQRDAIRICQNLLHVLLFWTRTFPYDFRHRDMISTLENLLQRLVSFESTFQLNIHQISNELRSKVHRRIAERKKNARRDFLSVERHRSLRRVHSQNQTSNRTEFNAFGTDGQSFVVRRRQTNCFSRRTSSTSVQRRCSSLNN